MTAMVYNLPHLMAFDLLCRRTTCNLHFGVWNICDGVFIGGHSGPLIPEHLSDSEFPLLP